MLLSGADGEPKYFEIPEHLCMRVKITHPTNEGINSMGLEWFGLPGEELFYYWNTLILGIALTIVSQLEVFYKLVRLLINWSLKPTK